MNHNSLQDKHFDSITTFGCEPPEVDNSGPVVASVGVDPIMQILLILPILPLLMIFGIVRAIPILP
jgi:hypothetical protein